MNPSTPITEPPSQPDVSRMTRRHFIGQTLALAAVVQGEAPAASAPRVGNGSFPHVVANGAIELTIFDDGRLEVVERATGLRWTPDPWEQAAGELTVSRGGRQETFNLSRAPEIRRTALPDGARFSYGIAGGVIEAAITLHPADPEIAVRVERLDVAGWRELVFPSRAFALRSFVDHGAGVLPLWNGFIVPSWKFECGAGEFMRRDDQMWSDSARKIHPVWGWSGLRMPWFGVTRDVAGKRSGWLAILDTPADAGCELFAGSNDSARLAAKGVASDRPRLVALSPHWRPSLGRLGEARQVRYRFLAGAGYVDLAQDYRRHAQKIGRFRSLRDKVAETPELARAIGATHLILYGGYPHHARYEPFDWSFADVRQWMDDVQKLSIERARLIVWGAYETVPPHCWPPAERKGGLAGWRETVAMAKRHGYLFSAYHAYSPMLAHEPGYDPVLCLRRADGKPDLQARWEGVCATFYRGLAAEGIDREVAAVAPNCNYTDILGVTALKECYAPEHGMSRTRDMELRLDFFRHVRSLGLVNSTEGGMDYLVPAVDIFDGLTYDGDRRVMQTGFAAPLFNLVYHDAVIVAPHMLDEYAQSSASGDAVEKALRDLAYGAAPLHTFTLRDFPGHRAWIRTLYDLVAKFQGETAFAAMTNHEFLSPDFAAFRTTFDSGHQVEVNLGWLDLDLGAVALPGRSYRLLRDGKAVAAATLMR